MATAVYLSNLSALTVNGVDLLQQVTAFNYTKAKDQLEATSYGDLSRVYVGGLFDNQITMSLYMSYIAGETFDTLNPLTGSNTTVVATIVDGAVTTVLTLTGCYLPSLGVISGSLGELSVVDVEFNGGTFS